MFTRFVVILCSLISVAVCCAEEPEMMTVVPRENPSAILHNPDMGWVLYENYVVAAPPNSRDIGQIPPDVLHVFDEVAIMFAWSDVEREEDQYDFTRVDFAYDYWKSRGKKIQLRMSTESLLWWNTQRAPRGKGVPDYVLEQIPSEHQQQRVEQGLPYTVVDARHPYYQARLRKFLGAVAKHFDKDRPVTLIDLRGFGVWGEWHSGFRYATIADRRAALSKILDIWSDALPDHYLALSNSWDPDGPPELHAGPAHQFDARFTSRFTDYVHYSAFDHAMTKRNVTFRRDGVGGAVFSNERRFNDEAFATLSRGPMSCEFVGSYSPAKDGGEKWLKQMINDALSLHPNYINLLGYAGGEAASFIREQPELVARGARQMGYRLVPIKLTMPRAIRSDDDFEITSGWINQGVGRAMRDFHLVVVLKDQHGKTIATTDAGPTGCQRWVRGTNYNLKSNVSFKKLRPGAYTLHIGLTDGDAPTALPLCEGAGGVYPIGSIECTRR